MITLGFTGTRKRPAPEQCAFIERNMSNVTELHHGCCEGSDYVAHLIAIGENVGIIWLHPPVNQKLMVPLPKLLSRGGIHVLDPKQYHARNRDIVDASDALIATPDGPRRPYSGTWYTIDYARELKKPVLVCLPNGEVLGGDQL